MGDGRVKTQRLPASSTGDDDHTLRVARQGGFNPMGLVRVERLDAAPFQRLDHGGMQPLRKRRALRGLRGRALPGGYIAHELGVGTQNSQGFEQRHALRVMRNAQGVKGNDPIRSS